MKLTLPVQDIPWQHIQPGGSLLSSQGSPPPFRKHVCRYSHAWFSPRDRSTDAPADLWLLSQLSERTNCLPICVPMEEKGEPWTHCRYENRLLLKHMASCTKEDMSKSNHCENIFHLNIQAQKLLKYGCNVIKVTVMAVSSYITGLVYYKAISLRDNRLGGTRRLKIIIIQL